MPTIEEVAARVLARATAHGDWDVQAAARLACNSILLPKITRFVDEDGWIRWPDVATYVIEGTGWSGGEVRLAKLGCSISGRLICVEDDVRRDADIAFWSIGECLYGLGRVNLAAVLNAVHFAGTGRPLAQADRPAGSGIAQ